MPVITVRQLAKRFDGDAKKTAVDRIDFEIPEGKLFTLLGPSGCGKTTTLRMLAGLETPSEGEIVLGGQVVYSHRSGVHVPTNKRPIGMVFQSYAIWPHMTVFDNIAFPLTVAKPRMSKKEMKTRTERVMEVVGLQHLSGRAATDLSGGQQQRVALARALAREPKVLLLDEPLSNLDAKLRENMREEIRAIQQKVGITAVFVTHDQSEALALSDLIMLMKDGKILEFGPPQSIYNHPQTAFGAEFVGVTNRFRGVVTKVEGGMVRVDTEQGRIVCPSHAALTVRQPVVVLIRPENIGIHPESKADCGWEGRVAQTTFQGDAWDYKIVVNNKEIRVKSFDKTSVDIGATVSLYYKPETVLVMPE